MNKKHTVATLPTIVCLLLFTIAAHVQVCAQPLTVGVAGLNHDHAYGLMQQYKNGEVLIAGIAEPNQQLVARYKQRYQLPDSIFYTSVQAMLKHIHPEAVLAYNAVADHLAVVEACAPKGISVMVEKPLATTVQQAQRMAALAAQYHIELLTNFETTWYNSNQQIYKMVKEDHVIDSIKRMAVHMGHQGPKEIGCSADFLEWLTDPVKNGGGAVMDFGCYGANLMTWLMDGSKPVSVTAVTRHIKPALYPNVDDDATILLEYANGATGIVAASWNWPFGIKDWEVFGEKTYLHALNGNMLQRRDRDSATYYNVPVKQAAYSSNLVYLADVLRGKIKPGNDLSSLQNNVIVVQILEAAKKSAKEGKKIFL
ncbi:MAG: Gfo/Idh/MocA family oxidoreductase [Chitinophagaceae bacterium]